MHIEAKNIHFSHKPNLSVLEGVSFSVEKGQILAILGTSGCGKSTLLRLVGGILSLDSHSGEISIESLKPLHYIDKGKLSFMFQSPSLLPYLSVRQNISLPLEIKNSMNPKLVDSLLQLTGLSRYADYLPKDLSGGMKTRTALAMSFVTKPEVLLLDEPFSSLDVAWKSALYGELKNLIKQYQTTVILVTHDISEAIKLADKIICLGTGGKVIFETLNDRSATLFSTLEEIIVADHKSK